MVGAMAADVSCLMRLMKGGDANESAGKSTAPAMTMELLAGCCTMDSNSKDLDLDLQVPSGWEKRLDLKSGKIYLQRCSSPNSSSSTSENNNKPQQQQQTTKFQDLNTPPSSNKRTLNLFDDDDDASLDLKLVSLSSPIVISPSSSGYQSVCTLDKVKSALERAEKETIVRKRSVSMSKSSSLRSNSSSSVKDGDYDQEERSSSASFAAGCPSCLMYVLISKGNPKCPRCNCNVPLPVVSKKPRIDLNISI